MRWNKFKIAYFTFVPIFLYISITTILQKNQEATFCNYCTELLITFTVGFVLLIGSYFWVLMKLVKSLRQVRKLERKLTRELEKGKEIISD